MRHTECLEELPQDKIRKRILQRISAANAEKLPRRDFVQRDSQLLGLKKDTPVSRRFIQRRVAWVIEEDDSHTVLYPYVRVLTPEGIFDCPLVRVELKDPDPSHLANGGSLTESLPDWQLRIEPKDIWEKELSRVTKILDATLQPQDPARKKKKNGRKNTDSPDEEKPPLAEGAHE